MKGTQMEARKRQGKIPEAILITILVIIIASSFFVHRLKFGPYHSVKNDPYAEVGTDTDRPYDCSSENRPSEGHYSSIPLGNTEFRAGMSLFMYTDEDNKEWDYCTVDVESEVEEGSWRVFYVRHIDIGDVPEETIKLLEDHTMPPKAVAFDEDSGVVTFQVGEKTFTYQLPGR